MFALSRQVGSNVLRNAFISRPSVQGLNKNIPTLFRTSAPLSAHNVKTPVQAYGHEYLQRQLDMKRPLSPHLGIYQPQVTWVLSGLHRITGCVMGGAVAVVAAGLMIAPWDFPQLIEYIRLLGLPAALIYAVKFCIAWPLTYHALNGIRFLGFDLAIGIDLSSVYKSGWFVVGASLALALLFTVWRKSDQKAAATAPAKSH